MTKSGIIFDPDARRVSIQYGARTVQTTDGNLLCYDPDAVSHLSMSVVFPDLLKDIAYIWMNDVTGNITDGFEYGEAAYCFITATPQEYALVTELETAPAGADFFQCQLRLHRSVAPSHSWKGRTLSVIPTQNQWLLWNGSQLLEGDIAIQRMLSVFIDNSPSSPHYRKLCLKIKQSVGAATNGYGTFGSSPGGGSITFNTTKGAAFFLRSQGGYGYTSPTAPPLNDKTMKKGASGAVATSDPTNMSSTYIVDVVGNYGIRS